jgi:hypothetical protein
MDDNILNYLNPGIRLTVTALSAAGFDPCDSGDGETHQHECDREGPYVVLKSNGRDLTTEAADLLLFLQHNGIRVVQIGCEGVQIQATYDPVDETAIIDVAGIHDSLLPATVSFDHKGPRDIQ